MNAINIIKKAEEQSGINVTLLPDGRFSLAYADGSTKRPVIVRTLDQVAMVLEGQLACISA